MSLGVDAARLVADQAPGQDVHPVSLPGIRAASDNIVSALIITFVSESVNNVNVFVYS